VLALTDPSDDTPGDRVKKVMAGKKPVTEAPFTVIEGGKGAAKKPRARKGKAEQAPGHDHVPEGPQDDELPPEGVGPEEMEKARHCRDLDQNDRDNGRRLLIWFGDNLAYVTGMGWLTWRETHWQRDEGELGARLLAQNLVDKIKLEANVIEASPAQQRLLDAAAEARKKPASGQTPEDIALQLRAGKILEALSKRRSERRKFAVGSGNSGKTEAMLKQAASLKSIEATALDADHKQFNLLNGTLRFVKVENPDSDPASPTFHWEAKFEAHNRLDMLTKRAAVAYDAAATCPEFERFLLTTQPDQVMRLFLQVFHAYALLLGGNDEQRLVFHFGTGANGKSAFLEALGRLADMYRAVVSPDTITGEQQRDGSKANSDIARLHSSRFVTIEELPRGTPLKENLIKALTGGTRMVARFLQKEIFEFDPVFTAVLSGNDMPNVSGTDYGIWRRLLLVHWGVTIPEAERLPFGVLMAKFDAERAGILNWLIAGALRYLNEGLQPFIPASVTAFTEDYREERDHVGVFVASCVIMDPDRSVGAGDMFKAYTDWCEANGLKPWTQTAFGTRLGALGIKKDRGRLVTYQGVKLGDVPTRFDPKTLPPRQPDGDPGWSP
jgi:putative DNA primase/helicase